MSIEEQKKELSEKFPPAVALASFISSKDSEFLLYIPIVIANSFLTYNILVKEHLEKLIVLHGDSTVSTIIKEVLLSRNSSEKLINNLTALVLRLQFSVDNLIGFFYKYDAKFLLDNIENQVTNEELKNLLIRRCKAENEKTRFILGGICYLDPAELLAFTNSNKLIVSYIMSLGTILNTIHSELFADILESIDPTLLRDFLKKTRSNSNVVYIMHS